MNRETDLEWAATGLAGIERSLFRGNDAGGRTSVVRLKAGACFLRHAHEGGENVLVLAGTVRLAGAKLNRGDHLLAEAGEEHDVVALSNAFIFIASQRATPLIGA